MTKPDDRQSVSYEEALSLVATGTTSLILDEGEVSVETYDATFVTALALILNLKALRKTFGYDHA